jgi:hypothetical protein
MVMGMNLIPVNKLLGDIKASLKGMVTLFSAEVAYPILNLLLPVRRDG